VNSPVFRVRGILGPVHREVTVSNEHPKWRELAEKAAAEQDLQKLVALVEELTGILSQREVALRQRGSSTPS